jgi:antitoxin Phd
MANWQVQQAKTRLSEVIEDAQLKGPQIITRHGSERAVVLSIAEYRRLTSQASRPAGDPQGWVIGGPKLEDDDPFFDALIRSPEPGRKIEF